MKIGYFIALIISLVGIAGVVYGITLALNPEEDESAFGVIVISGVTTFPIAGALTSKTRDPQTGDPWLRKEVKFA